MNESVRIPDGDEMRAHLDGLTFNYRQFCDADDHKLPLGPEERQRVLNTSSIRYMEEVRWFHRQGLIEGRDFDYDPEKRWYYLKGDWMETRS
jgi:hypothetical protein